jgi:phosphoglycolate phosphatase
MPYRLVIFDFDGTLADSAAWFRGVFNGVAERYGFRTVTDEDFAALRGRDNRAIVRHLGVPAWKIPLIARHMRALMTRDIDAIRLFPGAADLLEALRAGGARIAVVTSNTEENVRRVLGPEHARLVSAYGCGASLFGKGAKFRRVLKATGVRPAEAIAVGDEVRDIEAARAAGVAAGAVAWGYADPGLLRERGADHLFETMGEVARAVLERKADGL